MRVSSERRREIGRMGARAAWGDRYKADKIRELIETGMRNKDIARIVGCFPQCVSYQRKLMGLSRKNRVAWI